MNQSATSQQEKVRYQKSMLRDVAMGLCSAGGGLGYMMFAAIQERNWVKAVVALAVMIPTAYLALKYDRASR